ncbi:hypothetical protein QFZ41_002146 [Luteibacter sp. W1I16]
MQRGQGGRRSRSEGRWRGMERSDCHGGRSGLRPSQLRREAGEGEPATKRLGEGAPPARGSTSRRRKAPEERGGQKSIVRTRALNYGGRELESEPINYLHSRLVAAMFGGPMIGTKVGRSLDLRHRSHPSSVVGGFAELCLDGHYGEPPCGVDCSRTRVRFPPPPPTRRLLTYQEGRNLSTSRGSGFFFCPTLCREIP